MRVEREILRGRANRLLVFRAIKTFIDLTGRWPTLEELVERVPLQRTALWAHRDALKRADGLAPTKGTFRRGNQPPLAVMDLGSFGRDAA